MRCSFMEAFMEAKTNLKSRLPSRHVTEGPARMWSSLPSRQVFADQVFADQVFADQAFADSVERKALENAAAVVAASGSSPNPAFHLTPVPHPRRIASDL